MRCVRRRLVHLGRHQHHDHIAPAGNDHDLSPIRDDHDRTYRDDDHHVAGSDHHDRGGDDDHRTAHYDDDAPGLAERRLRGSSRDALVVARTPPPLPAERDPRGARGQGIVRRGARHGAPGRAPTPL